MKLNPGLADAVAVFTELGWADATLTATPNLPLGTAEQRRTALAGLRSGDWGEVGKVGENSWGWISALSVDADRLGVFAIRVGVDARRAARLLPSSRNFPDTLAAQVIAERGPAFAAAFIDAACRPSRRGWEHSSSVHGGAAVRVVADLEMAVPANPEYLKDWAVFAYGRLVGATREIQPSGRELPTEASLHARFLEHVELAVNLAVPATGPFAAVFIAGVRRGWLSREAALGLGFAALDLAQRPGDRKRWAELLCEDLGLTDAELITRADALVPVLATGEAPLIELLAPRLLAGVGSDSLPELALVSLMVSTRKAQRAVLAALAARPTPTAEVVDLLGPRLTELAADHDRSVARIASRLVADWQVPAVGVAAESAATQGWWQPTPPVWPLPDFHRGECTPEALTELASVLYNSGERTVDVSVEAFLAVANAVARADPAAARSALRGVKGRSSAGLRPVGAWLAGEPPKWGLDYGPHVYDVVTAREYSVFQRLGEVPCLLSEPSRSDLRVSPADLAQRLAAYRDAGASATEADLLLALTRLDLSDAAALADLPREGVPVVLQSGELMDRTAGAIVTDYLADPLVEPDLIVHPEWDHWTAGDIVWPASLAGFPRRLKESWGGPELSAHPLWGDTVLGSLIHTGEPDRELGRLALQVARRATPLPPGGAINILGVLRSPHPVAAEELATALSQLWRRGLLRPGVAQVRYLDWSLSASHLAALARALTDVARDGLLSVVWPVLDELVGVSLQAPRMLAGTSEVVEAIAAALPEVKAAVRSGIAPACSLDLPALRSLAGRPGSSRAVSLSRSIVAELPEAEVAPSPTLVDSAPVKVWAVEVASLPALPDQVALAVDWLDPAAPTRLLRVDLTLPDQPGFRYRALKGGWVYDLEREGQCSVTRYPVTDEPDADALTNAWLHWDTDSAQLVASEHRNSFGDTDGPSTGPQTPLSDSLVAISLTIAAQDGDAGLSGGRLVRTLAEDGQLGSAGVRAASRLLLPHQAFSPAKLMKLLEGRGDLLPWLWPLLTESVRCAGSLPAGESLPHWLNRVLDTALLHAPTLAEAGRQGRLGPDARWEGLAEIAGGKGTSAAVKKARTLMSELGA